VDVTIDVSLDKFHRKFESEIKDNILRRASAFFALNNWDYNQILRDTDLIKALSDIKEIQSFQVTFVTNDGDSGTIVIPRFNEIVRPDIITTALMYN
jgi:hypothetical protein